MGGWQRKGEGGPTAVVIAETYLSAVGSHDCLADRQPHAHTRFLGRRKRREQFVDPIFGNAAALVGNAHFNAVRAAATGSERYRPIISGVAGNRGLHAVAQQIQRNLLDLHAVD